MAKRSAAVGCGAAAAARTTGTGTASGRHGGAEPHPVTSPIGTLDAIDRAFIRRADEARRLRSLPPEPPPLSEVGQLGIISGAVDVLDPVPLPDSFSDPDSLVDRLLRAVPGQWSLLATKVEEAHRQGISVIAVAGGRRGEGRTTVVRCLARTLVARGRRCECHESAPLELPEESGPRGGCVVIVDAGVWFPGGPLRRSWLQRQSLGCQGVMLVRRADQPECVARGTAVESVGLKFLGEVLTMVPLAVDSIRIQ